MPTPQRDDPFLLPKDFVASPTALSGRYTRPEADRYTRWLATHHYENFRVVSFLLPRRLHQDFYNVYSFCRWADDLGDEIGDPAESLRLLEWWRGQTDAMYKGDVRHPVFVALEQTVRRHDIPPEPFHDLIRAFVQDQTVTRYENIEALLDYCRYSANPVGRLVLYLCGYSDAERFRFSDAACTGLQLANFCQDVRVDMDKDRIYVPVEILRRHGYSVERLRKREYSHAFRESMRELVLLARRHLQEGLPLSRMVRRRLSVDVELFSHGGFKILEKIEARRYNVFDRRPLVTRRDQFMLLVRTVPRVLFRLV
ncbi:MAG: squalene synthase HpnC [Bryobacteraceae bacterium]